MMAFFIYLSVLLLYWFYLFSNLTHTASSVFLSQSLSLNQLSVVFDHQSIPPLFLIFLYLRSSFCLINRLVLISTLSHPPSSTPTRSLSIGCSNLSLFAFPTVPTPPTFFTKVMNSTSVQVLWELPSKAGRAEGFRLSHRRVPHADFQGPIELPCHVNAHIISHLGECVCLCVL